MTIDQLSSRGRTRRDRVSALVAGAAVLTMSLGLVAVTASSASAHTPSFTADCNGVTAAGTAYEAQHTNTLTVTLDGVTQSKTFDVADTLTVAVPQDALVHTWSASLVSTHADPSSSGSASGTVGPCGTTTPVAVPAPKLNPPTCDTEGSVEWTPFTNGTWTAITGTGVGLQSATPVADDGFALVNPDRVTVEVLGKDSLDCRSVVASVPAPVVVSSATCEVPGAVTITPVEGVTYTWVTGSPGMTEGDYEIEATPEDGFRFDGAEKQVFTGTLEPAGECNAAAPPMTGPKSTPPSSVADAPSVVTPVVQSVPTVIDAGLTGGLTRGQSGKRFDLAAVMGQILAAGGLMLLGFSGWAGLARRARVTHQA